MAGPAFELENASPSGLISLGQGYNNGLGSFLNSISCRVLNTGSEPLIITAVNLVILSGGPGDFTLAGFSGPQIVPPGSRSIVICTVTYTPNRGLVVPGTTETAQLTFVSNAVSGTQSYELSATYQLTPGAYISLIAWDAGLLRGQMPSFDGYILENDTSGFGVVITVTNADPNPADPAITVSAVANTGQNFTVTPASVSLAPGASDTFTLNLTSAISGGLQDVTDAVVFTYGSLTFNFEYFYKTAIITPAFTLQGDVEVTCIALRTSTSLSSLNAFISGLPADDAIILSRQYYVDQPQLNKVLNRLWLLFERYGAFTLICTVSTTNPSSQPSTTDTVTGVSISDGLLQISVFDVQLTGSVINVTLSLPALGGVISLVGWVMKLDEIGEVIENT